MSLLRRASTRSAVYPVQGFASTFQSPFAESDGGAGGAVQSVAVSSTVDLICSLVSELPVHVYRDGRRARTPENILDPAGDGLGVEDWIYRLLSSWLLAGNAYGVEMSWDSWGRATSLDLVNPDDVTLDLMDGDPRWRLKGVEVPASVGWRHMPVNPAAGRILGMSRIELHAATIGISLASTRFGRQWFTDGAHPSGILSNSEVKLDAAQAKAAKDRFIAALRGVREPVVLGKGWGFHGIQISPEESQFLQTQGMSEAQCARIFGPGFAEVMGYATGGSMTYQNVVDRRQDLLVFSLDRWVNRVERVLTSLLPIRQEVKLNRDALLRSTTLARYQAHDLALRGKWKTVNEVRDIEDMDPVAWGDEPVETVSAGGNEVSHG